MDEQTKEIIREIIREEMNRTMVHIFQKHIQLLDGRNIQLGTGVGTKIGTGTTQLIGFFGKTPTVQIAAISSPSGGGTIDTQARAAIDSIRNALINLGLTA